MSKNEKWPRAEGPRKKWQFEYWGLADNVEIVVLSRCNVRQRNEGEVYSEALWQWRKCWRISLIYMFCKFRVLQDCGNERTFWRAVAVPIESCSYYGLSPVFLSS